MGQTPATVSQAITLTEEQSKRLRELFRYGHPERTFQDLSLEDQMLFMPFAHATLVTPFGMIVGKDQPGGRFSDRPEAS